MAPPADGSRRSLLPRSLLGVMVGVTLLGTWGFAVHTPDAPVTEHLYRSIQFFVLEAGDLAGPVPWQIEVARLAAPATTLASALAVAVALSRQHIDRWRVRRARDHVVVCGLGSRGSAAALALRAGGHEVVGIERDADAVGVARCRHRRVPVIIGDGRDPDALVAAGVARASHLVVLTPALGVSGQVALSAAGVVGRVRAEPLTIHVEIDDPHLASLLRAVQLAHDQRAAWRLEELDLVGTGAKSILDQQRPWPADAERAHVIVVDGSRLGHALASELRRRWLRGHGCADGLTLTVLAPEEASAGRLPAADVSGAPPTAVYVCPDSEAAALASTLSLLQWFPTTPVVLQIERDRGLADLLRGDVPQLRTFSLAQAILTPAVLLDGTRERIARALHESYRRTVPPDDPAAVSWELLPATLRTSNRDQAEHLTAKLAETGRVLVPDDGEPPDDFDDEEIELLGRREHERWAAERTAQGWRPGPRDHAAHTSPHLVSWEELDEETREVDRRFVRALPDILADAGLVIRRQSRWTPSPGTALRISTPT